MTPKIEKTEAQWKQLLQDKGAEPLAYHCTRKHGTERPFTGKYDGFKGQGQFACICCSRPLFDAQAKYDSGSGWPSFFQPLAADAVEAQEDRSLGMLRTEVHCPDCGAHLGHHCWCIWCWIGGLGSRRYLPRELSRAIEHTNRFGTIDGGTGIGTVTRTIFLRHIG